MIQFNLLPDVKLSFIKARRLKRLVSVISAIIAGASLAIFIILLIFVDVVQKKQITNLSTNITANVAKIGSTENLGKILTVQNQLTSLPALVNAKPAVSRVFGYLAQLTPCNVNVNSVDFSITNNSVTIGGTATSLAAINTYVDTLKFTDYSTTGASTSSNTAFSDVVLSSYSAPTGGQPATYSISADFAPQLFISTDNTTLIVPKLVTTRSEIDQPASPFQTTQLTTAQQCGS